MPRALITGITGQDGQFLADFLHSKGYQVFGLVKGQNNPKGEMVQEELPFVELVSGDLQDLPSLVTALEYTQPDEAGERADDQQHTADQFENDGAPGRHFGVRRTELGEVVDLSLNASVPAHPAVQ